MKHLLQTCAIFCGLCLPAQAIAQEITTSPICFILRNDAPYKVYGELSTNYFTNEEGQRRRHTGSFRLEAAGSTHPEKGYPNDRAEFCSSGPFYDGRQLELTIKALFPIFSCKTNIEQGEVLIKGIRYEDGSSKTWAECY